MLELGCKRPGEISLNFCVNVRGSKCNPKSYVNRDENTQSGYHVYIEFSDRSRKRLEIWISLWKSHWVLLSRQGLGIWMLYMT